MAGIASFFIPRGDLGTGAGPASPVRACAHLYATSTFEAFAALAALELLPLLACLAVLAGSFSGPARWSWARGALEGLFLLWCFALSTAGSLLCTTASAASGRPGGDDSSLPLFLFAVPLLLATVVLARLLGGSDPLATARMTSVGSGALLMLRALPVDLPPLVMAWSAGAITPGIAGILVAAGSVLSMVRSEAAVPPVAPQAA